MAAASSLRAVASGLKRSFPKDSTPVTMPMS